MHSLRSQCSAVRRDLEECAVDVMAMNQCAARELEQVGLPPRNLNPHSRPPSPSPLTAHLFILHRLCSQVLGAVVLLGREKASLAQDVTNLQDKVTALKPLKGEVEALRRQLRAEQEVTRVRAPCMTP